MTREGISYRKPQLTVKELLNLIGGDAVGESPQLDERVHLNDVLLVQHRLEFVHLGIEN